MSAVLLASTASNVTPLHLMEAARYPAWRDAQEPHLRRWLEATGFSGQPGQIGYLPAPDGRVARVLAVLGNGPATWAMAHLPLQLPEGVYRLEGADLDKLEKWVLGFALGAYQFQRYRSARRAPAQLLVADGRLLERVLALTHAVGQARDWVNTPTEDAGPEHLEAWAREMAQTHGGTCQVWSGDALLEANFPAIHAVGRASHRAPRLIEIVWGDPAAPKVTLAGKGVCFDTGGLDIKGADGMALMKKDMGGAALTLALADWVMGQKLKLHLRVLIPAVENAIGPNAYRPGEVISTRAGLKVEIGNTDAEGRVVLCDALAYACEPERAPELLIDFATLTGAARIALGPDLPATFGNREATRNAYIGASQMVEDPVWPMPLWDDYVEYLRSPIADLNNAGASRMGGAITAALYLHHFVPAHIPWLHLDTYCWNDRDRPGRPAGCECQGLRATAAFLRARYG